MPEALRRSLLYVPASVEAMVRKAATRGADVVILDLEDGVAPEAKDEARRRLRDGLREVSFGGCEVLVRINPPSTEWGERDLLLLDAQRPDGVVVPKVEDPAVLVGLQERWGSAVPLFPMLETARGVVQAQAIAACPGVRGLLFGAADYRESLRAGRLPGELELLNARSQIVLAARSAGVEALDTPWFDLGDPGGLEESARLVRGLGFDGKAAIHPAQVAPINRVFSPTTAEVQRAQAIEAALSEATSRGRGVALLDGELVEGLHLAHARRLLHRAARLGLLPEPDAGG